VSGFLELAERCEQATGPEQKLDAEIRCAVFGPKDGYVRQSPINGRWCIFETGFNGRERIWEPRGLAALARMGEFTASLDAAEMLVPVGWWWTAGKCSVSCDGTVGPDVAHCDKETLEQFDAGIMVDIPNPSTPALALCAAALRAVDALHRANPGAMG